MPSRALRELSLHKQPLRPLAGGVGPRFDIWIPSVPSNEPVSVQHASGIAGRAVGEAAPVLEADPGRVLRYEEILATLGYEAAGVTGPHEAAQACSERARFDAALVCDQSGSFCGARCAVGHG
jgi:hypothetical protein